MILLKKLIKILLISATVIFLTFVIYDYFKFKYSFQQSSQKSINKVINDILEVNANLRKQITHILIKHQKKMSKLIDAPENEDYFEEINKVFSSELKDYYTFTIADKHGELITDDFFEKVGRLCRQDIKEYAIKENNSWLTIHPGTGVYHYDLIVPWQYSNATKIIFISFKINALVNILKNNEELGHSIYIVRKDKSNLIELTSKGSRLDNNANMMFLSDEQMQGYAEDITGTYWTVIELPNPNLFYTYLKNELFQKDKINKITQLF